MFLITILVLVWGGSSAEILPNVLISLEVGRFISQYVLRKKKKHADRNNANITDLSCIAVISIIKAICHTQFNRISI